MHTGIKRRQVHPLIRFLLRSRVGEWISTPQSQSFLRAGKRRGCSGWRYGAYSRVPVISRHVHKSLRSKSSLKSLRFDSAIQFNLPGNQPGSAALSRFWWQSEMPLSCVMRLPSYWRRTQSSLSLLPRWVRGLYPLLHRNQERWWPLANPGSVSLELGPSQASVQNGDADASSSRIGLQQSTWRTLTFMSQFFLGAGCPYSLCSRVGLGSTGYSLSGCPCPPCVFTKVAEGALTPLWEVGIRIPNYLEHVPLVRIVVWS